jgi:hypothetical protein
MLNMMKKFNFLVLGLLMAAHLFADRRTLVADQRPKVADQFDGLAGLPPTAVQVLLAKVKAKIDQVNDYMGEAQMDIVVTFMKVPPSAVKVYFRKPNDLRILKQGGISILPKGGLNLNLSGVLNQHDYAAIDAGTETMGNEVLRVVKLVPTQNSGDVVLLTLSIDEKNLLIRKAVTTTRNNGTFELDMDYGKYIAYALPDKAVFVFNTSGFSLPKGLALDYDPENQPSGAKPPDEAKGKVILTYSGYKINKGVPASVFQ